MTAADGPHTITLRVIDAAGNVSADAAPHAFTVDATAHGARLTVGY